ncbi:amiloride-sensitive sodium channel subunit beta-like [Mytilus californianus]|uniref:amiloride-sensitive sodium channel subunit beta-like n=1 Tax=Mytilus californianus TaxID=6549 RepID=UPI0022462F6B|nr:amiloride-sensitive sodium channel subunit beta-like [Mytilus californianus]
MLINVNQSDYVPYIASEAGIRLSIHEHGSQPYLENSGISVATGFRTDISLIQKRIERIPGTTVCDPRNKFKNINACFEECIDMNVKKKCKCLLTFSRANNTKLFTCYTDEEFACIENVHENVTGCKCQNPCSEKKHEMTITTTRWPAENYEELLEDILLHKGLSVSNIRNSLMHISIFFSSLYEEVTEEVPSFTFENFLSNIGGSLGLWIGMSLISIGELLELCFFLLNNMVRRKKVIETQTNVNVNKNVEPSNESRNQFVDINMDHIEEGDGYK